MYLTIKRKESVSSILLFIFNVFLVERGITSIPLRKIFRILEPFQKNETAIRMGLSREIQHGLLLNKKEHGEVFYHLTDSALEGFQYWMKIMDYDRVKIKLQLEEWNGAWSLLALNNQDESVKMRPEKFAEELPHLSYGLLDKNVWISPYLQTELLTELIRKYDLSDQIHIFESRLTNGTSLDVLVAKTWPVARLHERYLSFLNLFAAESKALTIENCYGAEGLPLLYRLGLEYFEIVQDDPRLPLQLLPVDWPGLKAAKTFNQLREDFLPKAHGFINQILN